MSVLPANHSRQVCKDCQSLGRLLLELEQVALLESFSPSFSELDKLNWETACRNAKFPGDLVYCLYSFEQEVKKICINTKWEEHREEWEEKLLLADSCHIVALALYDFESHMLWRAVLDSWRRDRKVWARSVRGLYPPTLRALSDCLLLLEKYTKYEVISQRWRGERAKWMHRACYCRSTEELATAAILFEARLLGCAMKEEWRRLHSNWVEQLKLSPISFSVLASLLLQQERYMLESALASKWKKDYRPEWVLVLENIADIGR